MKYFILFGPPGAGKGTQATAMVEKYNLRHISTGELLRKEIAAGSELGLKAKSLIDAGALVPDEIVEGMIESEFRTVKGVNGFLLDGFPRTIAQAEALDAMASIDAVINFVLDDEEVVKRLSGRRLAPSTGRIYHIVTNPPKQEGLDDETGEKLIQRDDDKPEAIRHRLEVYRKETAPLIDYYRGKGNIIDIDASPAPEAVLAAVVEALKG